jgi:sulfotransferase family protein
VLPDFIIIGTQRGGTTSLYNYLCAHPKIAPARVKEVHYFSVNYHKGLDWYESFFPRTRGLRRRITGEASPYYIFHPHSPGRVLETCPDVKLIALLREPVARAFSHYRHEVALGEEPLSFGEAVAREDQRIAPDVERLTLDPLYEAHAHRHYSYVARGRYIEQMRNWTRAFPLERILVLRSEDLFTDPRKVYAETIRFLELPEHELDEYRRFNAAADTEGLAPHLRRTLEEYFRPFNRQLYRFLGRDLGWDAVGGRG